jgi:hypothetical protein
MRAANSPRNGESSGLALLSPRMRQAHRSMGHSPQPDSSFACCPGCWVCWPADLCTPILSHLFSSSHIVTVISLDRCDGGHKCISEIESSLPTRAAHGCEECAGW